MKIYKCANTVYEQIKRANTSVLGNIPQTDIYECTRTCEDVSKKKRMLIK
jgi:hypothetical protein